MEAATTMNNNNHNNNNNPTEPKLRDINRSAPQLANSSSESSSNRFSFVNRGGIDQIIEGAPSTVEGDLDSSLIVGSESFGDEIALVPGTIEQIRDGVCQQDHTPIVQVISVGRYFLGIHTLSISDGARYIIATCSPDLSDFIEQNRSKINNSIIQLQNFESEPSTIFEGRCHVTIQSFVIRSQVEAKVGNPVYLSEPFVPLKVQDVNNLDSDNLSDQSTPNLKPNSSVDNGASLESGDDDMLGKHTPTPSAPSCLSVGGDSIGDKITLVPGTIEQIRDGVCQHDHAPIVQIISVSSYFSGMYTLEISDGAAYTITTCATNLFDTVEQNLSSINNSIIRLHKFECRPSMFGKGRLHLDIQRIELVEHSSSRIGDPRYLELRDASSVSSATELGTVLAAEEDDVPVQEDTVGVDSASNNSTLDIDGTAPVPQDLLWEMEVAIDNNDATWNHSMELSTKDDTSICTSSDTDDYTEQGVSDDSSWTVMQDLLHNYQNSMDRILASMQDFHKNVGKIVDIMEKNATYVDDESHVPDPDTTNLQMELAAAEEACEELYDGVNDESHVSNPDTTDLQMELAAAEEAREVTMNVPHSNSNEVPCKHEDAINSDGITVEDQSVLNQDAIVGDVNIQQAPTPMAISRIFKNDVVETSSFTPVLQVLEVDEPLLNRSCAKATDGEHYIKVIFKNSPGDIKNGDLLRVQKYKMMDVCGFKNKKYVSIMDYEHIGHMAEHSTGLIEINRKAKWDTIHELTSQIPFRRNELDSVINRSTLDLDEAAGRQVLWSKLDSWAEELTAIRDGMLQRVAARFWYELKARAQQMKRKRSYKTSALSIEAKARLEQRFYRLKSALTVPKDRRKDGIRIARHNVQTENALGHLLIGNLDRVHQVRWKKMQSLLFHQSAVANVLGIVLIPNADDSHYSIATGTGDKRRLIGSIDARIGYGNNGCGKKNSVISNGAKQAHKPQTSANTTSLRPDSSTPKCGIMKLYDLKGWLKQNELYVEGCTPDSLAGFYKADGRIGDDEFTKDGRVYVDGSRIEVIDNVQYDFRVDEVPELSMLNKGMASAAEDSIDVESSQHHEAAQTFNTARIASDKSSGTYTSTRGIMKLHDITGWLKAATHHFEIVPKNSMNENVAQRANEIDVVETRKNDSDCNQTGKCCMDDSRTYHSATSKAACFSISGDGNTMDDATYVASKKSEIVMKRMATTGDCINENSLIATRGHAKDYPKNISGQSENLMNTVVERMANTIDAAHIENEPEMRSAQQLDKEIESRSYGIEAGECYEGTTFICGIYDCLDNNYTSNGMRKTCYLEHDIWSTSLTTSNIVLDSPTLWKRWNQNVHVQTPNKTYSPIECDTNGTMKLHDIKGWLEFEDHSVGYQMNCMGDRGERGLDYVCDEEDKAICSGGNGGLNYVCHVGYEVISSVCKRGLDCVYTDGYKVICNGLDYVCNEEDEAICSRGNHRLDDVGTDEYNVIGNGGRLNSICNEEEHGIPPNWGCENVVVNIDEDEHFEYEPLIDRDLIYTRTHHMTASTQLIGTNNRTPNLEAQLQLVELDASCMDNERWQPSHVREIKQHQCCFSDVGRLVKEPVMRGFVNWIEIMFVGKRERICNLAWRLWILVQSFVALMGNLLGSMKLYRTDWFRDYYDGFYARSCDGWMTSLARCRCRICLTTVCCSNPILVLFVPALNCGGVSVSRSVKQLIS